MYKTYWREFVDALVAEQYYLLYIHHSKRRLMVINAICLIMSFTGVATWVSNIFDPRISSLIILVSQIISVLQPLYPYADRVHAANCILDELRPLTLEAEQIIQGYLFDLKKECDLFDELVSFQNRFSSIQPKFASSDLFPPKKGLHKRAEKATTQYLRIHFEIE